VGSVDSLKDAGDGKLGSDRSIKTKKAAPKPTDFYKMALTNNAAKKGDGNPGSDSKHNNDDEEEEK
jgi:hypothetical protein